MVFIFAKTADDALAGLVKEIDALAVTEEKQKLASVVNLIGTPAEEANEKLKKYGEQLGLKKTPLALSADGEKFKISPDAEVTVMIYRGKKVKFNYALAKGELDQKVISAIVADTRKMLAEPPDEPPAKPKDAKGSAKDQPKPPKEKSKPKGKAEPRPLPK